MVFLDFWLPILCCYIFLWAGRSYLCFIACPNIRKCPLIKLRIFLKHFYGQSKHDLFWPSSSEWGIHLAAIPLTLIFFFEISYVDPVYMHKHLATWRVVICAPIFNRSFTLSVILEVTTLAGLPLPGALSTVSIPNLERLIHLVTVEYEQVPCPKAEKFC